ncbi:sugar-binding transcriptional regulator [Alicyclobacillus tolerans]|uniref:sugar-binding transcriptional regulator n=1 Tax=Alicyclobacillus tolerans TaxID=90970 RepID=UPI0009348CF4|nr:sugar-binding domain-containing protein [Alicyclobacillus montanus]
MSLNSIEDVSIWSAVRRLVPELSDELQKRIRILERILALQPIGRRALAVEMGTTERVLRAELDFLRVQGLLTASSAGVSLTEDGEAVLDRVAEFAVRMDGRKELAERVSRVLGIPQVVVVEDDSDQNSWVKDNLGYRAAELLRSLLQPDEVVGITGGTTMAAIARRMPARAVSYPVKVVPARGGLGEKVEFQANTIASTLAEKLGGESMMLHVPDRLNEETMEQLLNDPYVQQRLPEIRKATLVVHGIGEAVKMAKRRQVPDEEVAWLENQQAVAEAFGYYFNQQGDVVYSMPTIGLRLDDLQNARVVMAVAGGSSKARAVAAAAKAYRIDVLITDEGAARLIVQSQDYYQDK